MTGNRLPEVSERRKLTLQSLTVVINGESIQHKKLRKAMSRYDLPTLRPPKGMVSPLMLSLCLIQ